MEATIQQRILAYTAERLSCPIDLLSKPGTHFITATKPAHPDFMAPLAVEKADYICITELEKCSVVRLHPNPTDQVKHKIANLDPSVKYTAGHLSEIVTGEETTAPLNQSEPYYYLATADFTPLHSSADPIRQLTMADKPYLDRLHSTIPENMRWFVEIEHPIIWGYFENDQLVSAVSHFLFENQRIAAGGVLADPAYRRRGFSVKTVSVAMQWALTNDWIPEWSTWLGNPASMRIADHIGFKEFLMETDIQVN